MAAALPVALTTALGATSASAQPVGPGAAIAFGQSPSVGSPGTVSRAPVVGLAITPSNHGYWVVAADGGVFTYGDAGFFGSNGARVTNAPTVGIASTHTGNGYWLAGG